VDKEKLNKWFREWAETLIVAFVLAIFIRSFFLQVFWIPSGSMEPTLNINDRLIVNKIAYGIQNPFFESYKEKIFFYIIPNPLYRHPILTSDKQYFIDFHKEPKRFDVVVFKTYDYDGNRKDLIKRIIGLPGETLEVKKGIVYINGKKLNETHLGYNNYSNINAFPANFDSVVIPQESYFVMGDNRPNSADSRYWGFLPKQEIIGPALFKIWPVWQLSFI